MFFSNQKIVLAILLCVCLFQTPSSFAKNKLYYYEPETTELDGTIAAKIVNGPCDVMIDEYNKNKKEKCPFLILDEPIDVKIPTYHFKIPADPIRDKPEEDIEILQISNTGNEKLDFKVGDRVRVRGNLFRHFVNCHRTRVLIDIDSLKKIE